MVRIKQGKQKWPSSMKLLEIPFFKKKKKCKNSSNHTVYIQQLWLDTVFGMKLPPAILQAWWGLTVSQPLPGVSGCAWWSFLWTQQLCLWPRAKPSLTICSAGWRLSRCMLADVGLNHGNVIILKAHSYRSSVTIYQLQTCCTLQPFKCLHQNWEHHSNPCSKIRIFHCFSCKYYHR